jgi:hypothetical protein
MSQSPDHKLPSASPPSTAEGDADHSGSNRPGEKKAAIPGKKGFQKGRSGNPAGRPKGARNKATLIAEQLLDGESEAITRKVIELAKEGDLVALRLCLERIMPKRRSRAISFSLPPGAAETDLPSAYDWILNAVADGVMTIDEAKEIASLLEAKRRAIETTHLMERLEQIEAKVGIDP